MKSIINELDVNTKTFLLAPAIKGDKKTSAKLSVKFCDHFV
jgi:hypothetical protein